MIQKSLWYDTAPTHETTAHLKGYGTFKDSLKAPIHRWFAYPAGYSYKLVETKIRGFHLGPSSWIIDPFVGCGTTSVVAQMMGVNSIGIEAHPFVHWVARVKTFWEYDMAKLHEAVNDITGYLSHLPRRAWSKIEIRSVPALLQKCYSVENLQKLLFVRDCISQSTWSQEIKDYLNLGLTATLRTRSLQQFLPTD